MFAEHFQGQQKEIRPHLEGIATYGQPCTLLSEYGVKEIRPHLEGIATQIKIRFLKVFLVKEIRPQLEGIATLSIFKPSLVFIYEGNQTSFRRDCDNQ